MDSFVPFIIVVQKKLKKLKVKPILLNIAKFFNVIKTKPKQYHVTNFNN